jgi:catalase-peroxidase
MKETLSYQHSSRTSTVQESEQEPANEASYFSKRGLVAATLGVLGAAYLVSLDRTYPLTGSSRMSSLKSQVNMLGSSKKPAISVESTQAVAGLQLAGYPSATLQAQYARDLEQVDWDEVKKDLKDLLTDSQDWWPADYGTYGGLFIRLAWHSCGSYRYSDGRGGCDGGSQRFDPERSWPDNTNLDKARKLLQPIKLKYGNGVSWGDLFALTGTVAIQSMGGPDAGFCAGRLDVIDNSQTLLLGPTEEQDKFAHCEVNGQCPFPLGSNTLGLIYVNPEGPMGEPDLVGAAGTVRQVFGDMGWEGRELVALIGGGHTFGKTHGASTASNGDPPNKCPFAPWAGPTGMEAITSGLEGPWTSEPTKWDNKYFQYLMDFEWEAVIGPGGKHQWRVKDDDGPQAPVADPHSDEKQDIMMLTTDVALKIDPEYKIYVKEFAENATALTEAFGKAWYKLVTRDMGPVSRCAGDVSIHQSVFICFLLSSSGSQSICSLSPTVIASKSQTFPIPATRTP